MTKKEIAYTVLPLVFLVVAYGALIINLASIAVPGSSWNG